MEILILFIQSSLMSIRLNFLVAEQGLISEVNSPPHSVNPLSVAEGKKLRLVLDLPEEFCEVNRYLVKCYFRYEDLRSLAEVFQKGFCFFTWDLKSGYHYGSTISGFLMVNCLSYTIFLFHSTPVQA